MNDEFMEQQRQYWSERNIKAMEASQRNADILLAELLEAHQRAYNELTASLTQKLAELGIDKSKWNGKADAKDLFKLQTLLKEVENADREGLIKKDTRIALNISRLDALITEIDLQIAKLSALANNIVAESKRENYEKIFNETSNELNSFAVINKEAAEMAANKIWAGEHFSDSIWTNKNKLMSKLSTQIVNGILTGKSSQVLAKELANAMRTSYSNAIRVVRTELSYVINQATQDAYIESDVVEGQEWLAAPDEARRCKRCRDKSGEIFYFKNGIPEPSVHTPPLHPNCRCCLVPVLIKPVFKKYNE